MTHAARLHEGRHPRRRQAGRPHQLRRGGAGAPRARRGQGRPHRHARPGRHRRAGRLPRRRREDPALDHRGGQGLRGAGRLRSRHRHRGRRGEGDRPGRSRRAHRRAGRGGAGRLRRRDRPDPAHVLGGAGRGAAAPRVGPGRRGGRAGAAPGGRPLPRPPGLRARPRTAWPGPGSPSGAAREPTSGPSPRPWGRRSASRPTWRALRRTASGPFSIATALPLDEVERLAASDRGALDARLVSPADALAGLPRASGSTRTRSGRSPRARPCGREAPGALCRALDEDGALVADGRAGRRTGRGSGRFGSSCNPPKSRGQTRAKR